MALTDKYLTTTKNLESLINSVINAKAPDRFTNKFLEDLGYKSSNDRLYIGIFKALGLLDENGSPTERYFKFLDQTETFRILSIGIQEAYEDLFNLRKDAQNLSYDEVKNKLKTLTQGQKGDKVINCMAKTFVELCNLADWDTQKAKSQKISNKGNEEEKDNKQYETNNINDSNKNMNLHYNIQIHLPETTNMAVYDAIFQSLKKHLL